MRITKQQRKELSDALQNRGMRTNDFLVSGEHKEFILKYKFHYFSFSINKRNTDTYAMTILPIDNTRSTTLVGTWAKVLSEYSKWVQDVANESRTNDEWITFDTTDIFGANGDEFKEKFSKSEQESIKKSINILLTRISELEIEVGKYQTIEFKLNELSDKIDKLSKFDWKALFIGTVIRLSMNLCLSFEVVGKIRQYIAEAFSSLKSLTE